jgi:hypothetical protein
VSNIRDKSHTKAEKDSQAPGKGPTGGLRKNGRCEYRRVTTCVSGFHKPLLVVSNGHDEVSAVSTIHNRLFDDGLLPQRDSHAGFGLSAVEKADIFLKAPEGDFSDMRR